MNYKYLLLVFIVVILLVALIVYDRLNKRESFQNSEEENSDDSVSLALTKNIIFQKNMGNDIIYSNVVLDNNIPDNTDRFYLFNRQNSSINITNINSKNLTFSFYFMTMVSPEQSNIRQVLASSNFWYVDLINNTLRLVFNGIPVVSVVTITPLEVYNCVITLTNNGIIITVNGNEKSKRIDMPDLITRTVKLGLDKNNRNNFFGKIGGIFLTKEPLSNDEICEITNFCKFESTECSFVPFGPSITDCISSCSNSCKSKECQEICLGCNDPESCEWVESTSENIRLGLDADVPEPLEIRAIAHDESKILLDWKRPETRGGNIKSYIILVYESFNRSNGVRTSILSDPNCSVCEYLVSGLRNQVFYDVGVRAVNEVGISKMSNIETIAPNGPIDPVDISETLVETDNQIMKDFYKQLRINNNSCNVVAKQNREGHILDSELPDLVSEIKDFYSDKLKIEN
jgi:hypothetical protein